MWWFVQLNHHHHHFLLHNVRRDKIQPPVIDSVIQYVAGDGTILNFLSLRLCFISPFSAVRFYVLTFCSNVLQDFSISTKFHVYLGIQSLYRRFCSTWVVTLIKLNAWRCWFYAHILLCMLMHLNGGPECVHVFFFFQQDCRLETQQL